MKLLSSILTCASWFASIHVSHCYSEPWTPILPKGPCSINEHCSLNGACVHGICQCYTSWTGHNCQQLRLKPLQRVAGYGEEPNVSSWGASIYNDTTGYHLFVTEETDGKGLASWVTNSQIVHAISSLPEGPYKKLAVVSKPPTTNPQILYDFRTKTFLLFHIRGSGSFGLFTSDSVNGPWNVTHFGLGNCNNPTAAFHPNSSLYVMCHDSSFSLYRFDPRDGKPAWKAEPAAPIPTLQVGKNKNAPGNCEDPFIYFDRLGYFHVIAHCYTCLWYPSAHRPTSSGHNDACLPGTAFCSGHGFSRTGNAGSWMWIGGGDAPYNFTSVESDGVTVRNFSTRERPWALLGGQHGDDILALINGVSPSMPDYAKFVAGKDWTYTNIQPVGESVEAHFHVI